jgi:3-oxoacyl-[acyl-carrier protein] reductase
MIVETLATSVYSLTGKIALVTGVSRRRGIGAAVALALARAGVHVFTTYYRPYDALVHEPNDPEEATAILDAIRALGVKAAGLEADLADTNTPVAVFDEAERQMGIVDILINNAACDLPASIHSLTVDVLDKHYAVNVRGTTFLCAEFARRRKGLQDGRIINFTSGQGLHPMPENLPYALTKGAIEALTTSLSAALIKQGITVNAIDPGGTDTGWMSGELLAELSAKSPAGRVSVPEDAARLALFLASSQACWITGQILRSRGGN